MTGFGRAWTRSRTSNDWRASIRKGRLLGRFGRLRQHPMTDLLFQGERQCLICLAIPLLRYKFCAWEPTRMILRSGVVGQFFGWHNNIPSASFIGLFSVRKEFEQRKRSGVQCYLPGLKPPAAHFSRPFKTVLCRISERK